VSAGWLLARTSSRTGDDFVTYALRWCMETSDGGSTFSESGWLGWLAGWCSTNSLLTAECSCRGIARVAATVACPAMCYG